MLVYFSLPQPNRLNVSELSFILFCLIEFVYKLVNAIAISSMFGSFFRVRVQGGFLGVITLLFSFTFFTTFVVLNNYILQLLITCMSLTIFPTIVYIRFQFEKDNIFFLCF